MRKEKVYIVDNDEASCDECFTSTKLVFFENGEIFLCEKCLSEAYELIMED